MAFFLMVIFSAEFCDEFFRGKIQDGAARCASRKKIRGFLLLVSLRYSQHILGLWKKIEQTK